MEKSHLPPVRRTKAQTKLRLIDAVGEIIKARGYSSLSETSIARQAGVSSHLIGKYFETPEKLIEEYLQQRTESKYPNVAPQPAALNMEDTLRNLVKTALEEDYRRLIDDPELTSTLTSQLVGQMDSDDQFSENEETGSSFFNLTDERFKDADLDFRSLSFILESGMKFLALKSKSDDSVFCGIDTASAEGREQIIEALKGVIDLAFEQNLKK